MPGGNSIGLSMQALEDGADLSVPEQASLVAQAIGLADRLDDEQIAILVQRLVALLVRRADGAETGQESARRHARIQALIKRL